ncbi:MULTISPECIES: hypothetical protein [Pseudomonas]|uniref:hypothetical protein n=1 Tax=Pseudomonas TaxID=286 RepID=UPI00137AF220|nr:MULTISPECIES: hypothetical protein [Pseudomonas]MBI6916946.1 hypothetical protein [Pseudomonas juntendi]MBR7522718.1 hypothetical protein [Pseudomonas juntendi]
MRKPTKKQLIQQVAERAAEYYLAQAMARRMKMRLNREYGAFFMARGEPDPNSRRIDPSNPMYEAVIAYTAGTYDLYQKALRAKHNAKRAMESAIRAMIGPAVDLEPPLAPSPLPPMPLRRTTATGETLQ